MDPKDQQSLFSPGDVREGGGGEPVAVPFGRQEESSSRWVCGIQCRGGAEHCDQGNHTTGESQTTHPRSTTNAINLEGRLPPDRLKSIRASPYGYIETTSKPNLRKGKVSAAHLE